MMFKFKFTKCHCKSRNLLKCDYNFYQPGSDFFSEVYLLWHCVVCMITWTVIQAVNTVFEEEIYDYMHSQAYLKVHKFHIEMIFKLCCEFSCFSSLKELIFICHIDRNIVVNDCICIRLCHPVVLIWEWKIMFIG